MKTRNQKWLNAGRFFSLLGVVLMLAGADQLSAQYRFKWMTIGRLHSVYSEAGAVREMEVSEVESQTLVFPAIEMNAGNKVQDAMWVAATNWTDEDSILWPVKIAHVGPRMDAPVQAFTREFKLVSRFDPPVVRVDGDISYRFWAVVDEVDPDMKADRMIYNRNVNIVGIELEQKIYAFDQEYHDNYHIIEYTFKNTGDADEDEEDVEYPDQVLKGVYFCWLQRYAMHEAAAWITGGGAPWGQFTMNDAVGDGHEDYGVNFTAQYMWAGYNPEQRDFCSLGQPMWFQLSGWLAGVQVEGDSLGRLASGHFAGRVYLHADSSADDEANAAADASHVDTGGDPKSPLLAGRQPSTMGMFNSDNEDLSAEPTDPSLMIRQYYDYITAGRAYPHHADLVEPSDPPGLNFATPTNDPSDVRGIADLGGWQFVEGFGPYTMKPGDDVRLVVAEGVAGLSDSAKLAIGIAYKAAGADKEEALIEWPAGSGVSMTKNEWVMTCKDSLFDMFERAVANYENNYVIPRAPMPPATFDVTSSGEAVTLAWETYAGESDPGSWEIWRTSPILYNATDYEKIATLSGSAREYTDAVASENGPIMGLEHFYYLQAVGRDPVENPTLTGTPASAVLKSNRYYTQTYFPVMPGRLSGELADIVIVPNPWHIGAAMDIRFPDVQDKLAFLDIPPYCIIKIYTQLGELVDTIEHDDGTGDEYWDHTAASRQLVASGLYIAVFEEKEDASLTKTTGKTMKKFVIIH